jgi:hypothetical protein
MKTVARTSMFEKKERTEDLVLDKAGGHGDVDADRCKDTMVNFWGQAVSNKEARAYEKCKKKSDVAGMRKVLQVPKGKVMPGFEELGNGSS